MKGYDYSQNGAYFIIICTQHRECLFGEIHAGKMVLNEGGEIAKNELKRTSEIRKNIEIDCLVVMPNHIHAIVVIHDDVRASTLRKTFASPSNDLGAMICGYKSIVTKKINQLQKTPEQLVWQRNYYEHIIRNEESFEKIAQYIHFNSQNWEHDDYF